MVVIFARNVMLCAQFAVQRAFNYAPVSSIGRFGVVLADNTLKLSGVSVCVCTSPKNSCYCFCINKSLLLGESIQLSKKVLLWVESGG